MRPTESGPDTTTGPTIDMDAVRQRIADRRSRFGLAEETLADRAGMAPAYFQHVIEAGPLFDPGGLQRIAAALGMTYEDLLDGPIDPPPGRSAPSGHPALIRLTEAECRDRIGDRGVGRIALPADAGPVVLPVNYTVDGGTVVYRTAPHTVAAVLPGSPVSFQVDRIDERTRRGWSVLITGAAEHVTDPAAVAQLERRPGAEPWAGGDRPVWIRIRPDHITGRRIGAVSAEGRLE
ncbi:helix-turn-helix domain-containing protein [Kitasatospora paranensis]|uniref:Helix-turn-helix domain-containing protein n=1 Tax=Kitasatospora paranensis TaxID=258053 RepID=A0ABW2FRF6_9ACTN